MAATKQQASTGEKHGLMLRLPKRLHSALRHVSIDRGQSLNALIAEVLAAWWAKQPERDRYSRPVAPRRGDKK